MLVALVTAARQSRERLDRPGVYDTASLTLGAGLV
jgi:hypothetical protein